MNASLARMAAIVRADFLIRFRRISTLVVFLLMCLFAYLWVPDPATGRALLQINGQRAIYNSGAIGMATASIGAVFIGLAGFYVISNAIGRDVRSRCGSIIASTEMRSGEYLAGKFLGNVVFLVVFMGGFMLSSMAMLLIRAEAPLEIGPFVLQYLLLVPPSVVFVSAIAVVFESIRFLSGRIGDVVYFFLWAGTLGTVAASAEVGHADWPRYVDHSGFVFMIEQLKGELNTTSISIGASSFDPKKAPFDFGGLHLEPKWILPRISSTLFPLSFLLVARLFFHRFDPVRLKSGGKKRERGILTRLSALMHPLARVLGAVRLGRGGSLVAQSWQDAMLTFALVPVSLLGVVGLAIASMASPESLMSGVFPIGLAALAVLLSDVASRDERRGTLPLVMSSPRLREKFVLWKFLSMLFTASVCLVVPLIRVGATDPRSLFPLVVGTLFIVSAANAAAVFSRNPKTFIVLFLLFWYVVMNDKGATRALDFAGFFGRATPGVTLAYLAAAIACVASAHWFHVRRLAQ